jgi:ABC-type multidrug transport system ATPase subunit/CRP-like cAMP-binding protein/ABC-type multidrug transport system permease subunit
VNEDWGELGRRVALLQQLPLFAGCSPDVLTHVAAALRPVTFAEGHIVCREGDPGDVMYLIREGTALVTTRVGEQSVELARLGPGQFFGEQALLSHDRRTATVRGATPLSLWALSAVDFDELVTRVPTLAAIMAETARKREQGKLRAVFEVESRNLAALAEGRSTIRIGRAPDNDIVFESNHVSRSHAVLERVGDTFQLRDLNSANGTSVNGERVRATTLKDGDEVRVGTEWFIFDRQEIKRWVEPRGVSIDVRGLNQVVKGGKQLLHDINLSILPGEFVAIVGGSGAGKTTLMDAMSGVRPPSSGTVRYNARDYYENMDLYRNVLGYVPQDDIIHTDLPLRRTFYHAAKLRLPEVAKESLDGIVDETVTELGLGAQVGTRVQQLSGGQRKRSSIGVELLTHPRIFYLDEPTSGLDPATETQMMRLMRRLSDDGSTVLTTTHATKNVMLCDKVVFLARGGYLAFAGSPRRALQYFGAQDFDEIYERLANESTPEEWARRFQASEDYATMISQEMDMGNAVDAGQAGAQQARKRRKLFFNPIHRFRQFTVLTHRSYDMIIRYPANLFALFVQPAVITLLLLALFNDGAFRVGGPNPTPAIETLLVISFAMFFFGVSFGLNEICKEFTIFSRERMVNLGILPYVLSKVAVLGPFLVLAAVLILAVLRVTSRLPADGISTYLALFLTMVLTEIAGLAIGLMASSAVPSPDVATRLLPVVLLPQALFSGGFVARPAMNVVGQWISAVTVMRWSFEGAGRNLDVNGLMRHASSGAGAQLMAQYGDAFSRNPQENWIILGAFVVVPLVVACLVLYRRTARA